MVNKRLYVVSITLQSTNDVIKAAQASLFCGSPALGCARYCNCHKRCYGLHFCCQAKSLVSLPGNNCSDDWLFLYVQSHCSALCIKNRFFAGQQGYSAEYVSSPRLAADVFYDGAWIGFKVCSGFVSCICSLFLFRVRADASSFGCEICAPCAVNDKRRSRRVCVIKGAKNEVR